MKVILGLMILILMTSCGNDDFDKQSELSGLRILSISADSPEINTAGTVNLTPLVSYVDGGGANLNYSWEACPDPGLSFGAKPNCGSAVANLKLNGTGNFNTGTLSGTFYTGFATSISLSIPPAVFTFLNTLDTDLQFNGYDFVFFITYTDPSTQKSITSMKKISLTTKETSKLNVNPSFSGIEFESSVLSAFPQNDGDMKIINPSRAQTYTLATNIGEKSFDEDAFVSWYASRGEFTFSRTDSNEPNSFESKGSSGVFVAVYRDGRGGIATSILSF